MIHAGAVYLQCIMPFYFMFAIMFCLNNAMRGAGDSVFPMVDVILSLILVRVPAVYWLADHYGPDYMYYGCAVGWTVGLALSLVWYFSGGSAAEAWRTGRGPKFPARNCESRL